MSSDLKNYGLMTCAGCSIEMEKSGFFSTNDSIPKIDGQAIKGAYVSRNDSSKQSRLPNVEAIKEFGKATLGVTTPEGQALLNLDGKVLVISRKHVEILVARVVVAVSVLFVSYLLFRNII